MRSASAALARPIRGRSSKTSTAPEHLAEDLRPRPEVGWICGAGDLQQRGLAGAVGPEDHPALVLVDHPVEAVDDRASAAEDGHLAEVEHLDHAAHPTRAQPRRRAATCPTLLQVSAAR